MPYSRSLCLALFMLFTLTIAACSSNDNSNSLDIGSPRQVAASDYTTTPSGLQFFDFRVGDGPVAQAGDRVSLHYSGWLLDGTPFDSSRPSDQPLIFQLGAGRVIPGFDEGITGMQIGGDRQMILPPTIAYGAFPPPGIPPNATLIFEVELLDILDTATAP